MTSDKVQWGLFMCECQYIQVPILDLVVLTLAELGCDVKC